VTLATRMTRSLNYLRHIRPLVLSLRLTLTPFDKPCPPSTPVHPRPVTLYQHERAACRYISPGIYEIHFRSKLGRLVLLVRQFNG